MAGPHAPPPARIQAVTSDPVVVEQTTGQVHAIRLPPWAVILHNDDHNDMLYVVKSLVICVPEVTPEDAVRIMYEAHESGKAVVIVCPRERAELYRDRLESRGLTATIEKA